MMKTIKSNIKLLKDPKNYVAIYARTSSKVENNSIAAQISEAKRVIANKGLLLYAVYVDQVSGFKVSPPDRVGFGKLLEDAKSGCFSTLVAYKHDRIARNLNDWVNLKNQLRKLKIKIIFSDDNEYSSDNSLQGEFLENLIVMVGELEPNTIKERTSAGRLERRKEGAYSSGAHCPFGYKKIPNNKLTSKGKSYYPVKPLKAIFVQHLFCEAKEALDKNELEIEDIKRDLQEYINNLLKLKHVDTLSEALFIYAHTTHERLIKSHEKEGFIKNININLNDYLKENEDNLLEIKKELIEIKDHIMKPGNINSLLRNSTYGGYMLKKTKEDEEDEETEGDEEKEQSIIIEGKIPRLNKVAFIKLNNVDSIIDEDTFAKVYSYMRMPDVLKEKEPNYLFKGKLKCGNCKVLISFTDGLLQCNCKSYAKNSVIEAILDIIIDDAFGNSENGFNNFRTTIKGKLDALRCDLQSLRYTKICQLQNYLKEKDKGCIRIVQETQDEITALLQKIAAYANELSYINRLQQVIECYNNSISKNEKSDSDISKIKSSIITYIESNQDIFNPIFNKLIKEIKVSTLEQKNSIKCRFAVNYEFNYKKPEDKKHSDISKSIH